MSVFARVGLRRVWSGEQRTLEGKDGPKTQDLMRREHLPWAFWVVPGHIKIR